jgi:hypothetical protein
MVVTNQQQRLLLKRLTGIRPVSGHWRSLWMKLPSLQRPSYQDRARVGSKLLPLKNLNFRAYLKEEFRHNAWKKSMPVFHLEDEWQDFFKGIQLYITSEGRYDKLMLYHFKILDHFTCKTLLLIYLSSCTRD